MITPTQEQLGILQQSLDLPFKYLIVGDRGTGKTTTILMKWIEFAQQNDGDARGVLLYRGDNKLYAKEAEDYLDEFHFRPSGHRGLWKHEDGSSLRLHAVDRFDDANRLAGAEYNFIAWDEIQDFSQPNAIDFSRGFLRSKGTTAVWIETLRLNWIEERYMTVTVPHGVTLIRLKKELSK